MEHVHEIDIAGSKAFLESLESVGRDRALDCAAGIGRISKHLLCPVFRITDVIEPAEHLIRVAKAELPPKGMGEFQQSSLQTALLRHTYDVIAIPWAAAYLRDEDLIAFLSRCKSALHSAGAVFLKDNISSSNRRVVDREDNSQIRSDKQYKAIFASAGLTCFKECRQEPWPLDLHPAKMYALR